MKRSRFYTQQMDNSNPTFLAGELKTNALEDESSYFSYGQ